MSGIPACGYCGQFAFQFSITAYPVFRQEIHGLGGLFQIVQLRPMGEACALLCLDVILDINEQADLYLMRYGIVRPQTGCESICSAVHIPRWSPSQT